MDNKKIIYDELHKLKNKCALEKREPTGEERSRVSELVQELEEIKNEDLKFFYPNAKPSTLENGSVTRSVSRPFKNFGEQLRAIHAAGIPSGQVDPRLYELRAASGLQESVSSDGGFLVQTDFASTLLQPIYDNAEIPKRISRIPVSANANGTKINCIDETSRSTGSRWGGIQTYWVGEADEKTKSKPKFRQMELNLKKLIGLCYATDEMLADSTQLDSVIRQGFRSEFDFAITDAVISGDGVGKPLGILKSGCLVSVNKETGQRAKTILAENVINMWSRLQTSDINQVVWIANKDTIPQLYTMSLSVGTGGVPIYMPAGGISGNQYSTLFGRPVIFSECSQTLGTVGDLLLADLGQYIAIDKGGIQEDMSIHVRFVYDESVFRFVYRIDGQPALASAITPFKGSDTLSPFVALQSRT